MQVQTKTGMIVVEGVNVKKKTVQPKPGTEEKGQIVQTESPIHHSNAMLYSKEKQIRSRVGHKCVPLRLQERLCLCRSAQPLHAQVLKGYAHPAG